ncbi:MAG: class D sortase [Pseudomonadota bacterium]|nr:class D sortase [Pseudomonadota bacterium]
MPRTLNSTRLVEATAWIAGTALLAAYGVAQWHFHRARDAGLSEFAAALEDVDARASAQASVTELGTQPLADAPAENYLRKVRTPDMDTWSPGRIAAYQREVADSMPQAVLRIGSIDLEVPVYAGVTESNLNRGAAWIDGTAPLGQHGNAGLAAHRDGYFRALRHINIGDRIEVQTLQRTTSYVVDQILIVEPKDVQVLAPDDQNRLTLVTCYPFYVVGSAPQRFIVRALAADTLVSAAAPS